MAFLLIFETLSKYWCYVYVGNKAKGRISKRVFRENKARQIFRKKERFLPPDTHKCPFFGKFDVLCFFETPVLRFALLPYDRRFLRCWEFR